jgi:hypothetical protein
MRSVLRAASGGTPYQKFRGHYLATRLDERAGILARSEKHNVMHVDPGGYLVLADPTWAPLPEIIDAIEAKHGTSPSADEYLLLKDVCDALNNRDI